MLGWQSRTLFASPSVWMAGDMLPGGRKPRSARQVASLGLGFAVACVLATALRLLELPFWDNPDYRLGHEFLLATHDAYHWIAGAEGFEFGAGHPMSELARLAARFLGTTPAEAGFWLPPYLGGLLAGAVFLWGWGLGQPLAGLCAGLLASLAPAFLARTLLGFYDTDLVVLPFAVLMGLIPALWLAPWLASLPDVLMPGLMQRYSDWKDRRKEAAGSRAPGLVTGSTATSYARRLKQAAPAPALVYGDSARPGVFCLTREDMEARVLSLPWLAALIASGLFGWQTQVWHSLFPYLVRYCALLPLFLIPCLGPVGGRLPLLRGALCHSLPLLGGLPGAVIACVYAILISRRYPGRASALTSFSRSKLILVALWGGVIWLALDSTVFDLMLRSFASYADRTGHIGSAAADPVVFPSVARSIIEVQTIALPELLLYSYPHEVVAVAAFVAAAWLILVSPAFLWLLPLLALSLLSLRMGARMTMFGPPVLMLALCLEGGRALEWLFYHGRLLALTVLKRKRQSVACLEELVNASARRLLALGPPCRLAVCALASVVLVWPLLKPLPDYVQGPIISREQAEALAFLQRNSPDDSVIWNWWDWGYAAHHFSRRQTIADGARHSGPSLYLPAAVYTTSSPHFARQLIKHAATRGSIPGNVFDGLSAAQAQALITRLRDKKNPPVSAPGTQYLVVSLDLLRLGLWVTRYGSWDFIAKQGPGAMLNTLSPAISFNPDTGQISADGSPPLEVGGIAFFNSGGLDVFRYNRPGAYYFLFNQQNGSQQGASALDVRPPFLPGGLRLRDFWLRVKEYDPFSRGISDKLAMDEAFFDSLMVQLLIRPANDPEFAPYFKLVFDNTYVRVYEVL